MKELVCQVQPQIGHELLRRIMDGAATVRNDYESNT